MRLLPCPTCGPAGAMLPPSLAYPKGEPHFSGAYVREYQCARCREAVTLTPAEYNRLRHLTLADFQRLAVQYGVPTLAHLPTKDLEGVGFTRGQARQLFAFGIETAHHVEEQARG